MENRIKSVQKQKVNILVVGAGLAGLVSAFKLLEKQNSLMLTILEASDVVGGQLYQTQLGELGGKWITDQHQHIYQLLQSLKVPMRHRTIMAPTQQRCWDIDRGVFADLAKFELERYIRELEINLHYYRPHRFDTHKRSQTMKRHIHAHLFFNSSRKFMLTLVQLMSGADASRVTYNEFMSTCSACGGVTEMIDLYLVCPDTLLEFSSNELLQAILEKLHSAEILLKRRAEAIRIYRDFVEVQDSENVVYMADVVILAIPGTALKDIEFTPRLPAEMKLPSRSDQIMTSFIARYPKGYWRRESYSGSLMSTGRHIILGQEYRPTIYSGLIVHKQSGDSVESTVLEKLAEHFGPGMLSPIEYSERSFEVSTLTKTPFVTPWKRVVWSSSNTAATCLRGCLGGAVQSGLRAAIDALLLVRPQVVSWQDIAEMQRCDKSSKRDVSWVRLWTSSLNLYNVTFYSVFICSVVAVLRMFYRKHNL